MEFQPEGKVFLELFLTDGNGHQKTTEAHPEDGYEIVTREIYNWNKITTCIHNLFGTGNLWADLYGECMINCSRQAVKRRKSSDIQLSPKCLDNENTQEMNPEWKPYEPVDNNLLPVMKCKLEFLSAAGGSYWGGNNRQPHEIQGTISNSNGKI